ncbi:MAG: alpha/beta fold hydrolase [Alphaproteobacteria bacterium]|nr:alpha/beta fold hydrolase [Alphaproteobacteria bacterium]
MAAEQGSFTASDGCTIAYTLHRPSGPAAPRLALIHSLALDRSIWDGVVERLSPRAEIVTYDCRGHGRSGRPHMPYTAELFARDLAQLFIHLDWRDATVAGCSMGGCVAQAFAGLHKSRVRALALIDTSAWYGPEAPKQFRERAAAAKAKGMQGLIDFQIARWFSEKFTTANPAVVDRFIKVFLANDFECYAATCALLGDADLRHYLPSFRMPVAVLVGEEDYAAPVTMANALHAAIPQSTLKIIAGGRHLTPIQCPDEIAGEIAGLMERAA